MASTVQFMAQLAMLAVVLPSVAMATQYIVGDEAGWTVNYDYVGWAKDKTFYVGDTLVFQYTPGNHNVFKVNQTAFKDCVKPAPNEALISGNDTITLAASGKKWYICGVSDHCANKQQKLTITVEDSSPSPAPTTPLPVAPAPNSAHGFSVSAYVLPMAAMAAVALLAV